LATDPFQMTVLQHTQQAHLRRRQQVADLVQEECASFGAFEPSLARVDGARERAPLVTEELRVDELGRNRAAVDAHKGCGCPRRTRVDGPGYNLLPGTCLAEDEHRYVGPRDEVHTLHHGTQTRVGADHGFGALRASETNQQ
jgi:hypothetical protein